MASAFAWVPSLKRHRNPPAGAGGEIFKFGGFRPCGEAARRLFLAAFMATTEPIDLVLSETQTIRFVWVRPSPPEGAWMGSLDGLNHEQPRHRVRFSQGFWMQETPVTQAQFALRFPEHHNHYTGEGASLHPAEQVQWQEAVDFCAYINQALIRVGAMPPGYTAGLPLEAEWEYACRGATETEYSSGDGAAALHSVGWSNEHPEVELSAPSDRATRPVKLLRRNTYGLYDMHGNVWEWCRDYYSASAYRRRPSMVDRPEQSVAEEDPDYANYRLAGRAFSWLATEASAGASFDAEMSEGIQWLRGGIIDRSTKIRNRDQKVWIQIANAVDRIMGVSPGEAWHCTEDEADLFKAVSNWCQSLAPDDPTPPRVLRGGSWNGTAAVCRAAYRVGYQPLIRDTFVGFRVCLGPRSEEERGSGGG